jgi:hypothetical protein
MESSALHTKGTKNWDLSTPPSSPSVHYICHHAPDPHTFSPAASIFSTTHLSLPSLLHPLSALYYCDKCSCVRCDLCTVEEIVCYYCTNCLFEVPTAAVKSEKNR